MTLVCVHIERVAPGRAHSELKNWSSVTRTIPNTIL